jgi:hypothetical protein
LKTRASLKRQSLHHARAVRKRKHTIAGRELAAAFSAALAGLALRNLNNFKP